MALLLSGYNRNARISRNDFKWIGDSAIVSWGRTTGDPSGEDGWDGRNGDQPRYNIIEYNFASEVGIHEKQSSLYMQAKTSDSLLYANVGFNGPRAGINFNDGFGGNSTLMFNLVFNFCRESGDHGPFNRCVVARNMCAARLHATLTHPILIQTQLGPPAFRHIQGRRYDWLLRGLEPCVSPMRIDKPAHNRRAHAHRREWSPPRPYPNLRHPQITQNFFIANYESSQSVDNDDGTAYYNTSRNLMMYGGAGMKSDCMSNIARSTTPHSISHH